MMPKYLEGLLQVLQVIDFLYTLSDHVVYVYFHCLPYKCCKDFLDKSLVSGSSILQAKQHHIVAV